jgi:hypothetical protein
MAIGVFILPLPVLSPRYLKHGVRSFFLKGLLLCNWFTVRPATLFIELVPLVFCLIWPTKVDSETVTEVEALGLSKFPGSIYELFQVTWDLDQA